MTNQLQPPLSYHIDPTIYAGRPTDSSGRLPKELRTYDLLDSLHTVSYTHLDVYKRQPLPEPHSGYTQSARNTARSLL